MPKGRKHLFIDSLARRVHAELRSLDLPDDVRNVIVLADGEDAGEAAARDCAWRWKREGRRVRIARPPRGMDFNDLLLGHARQKDEAR